jgi:hypothetical protein
VFRMMRRRRRSAMVKHELGQSVDHFKRAATLAAHETGATVGPKLTAARDRVQPAATKAKGAASNSWESAVATLAPLITAASENVRHAGEKTQNVSRKQAKASRKRAKKLEKRANKALGREQTGRRTGKLFGLALVGAAIGAGAAYMARKRKAAQWDEYDPSAPIASATPVDGADDAAFEPVEPTTGLAEPGTAVTDDPAGQTFSPAQSDPKVSRLTGGNNRG